MYKELYSLVRIMKDDELDTEHFCLQMRQNVPGQSMKSKVKTSDTDTLNCTWKHFENTMNLKEAILKWVTKDFQNT